MTPGEIVIAAFVLMFSGGLGALQWRRFGELREDLAQVRAEGHADVDGLREEMRAGFARVDRWFEQVDRRFEQVDRRFEQVGRELGILRSDLTHVALAVGAKRPPHASEA